MFAEIATVMRLVNDPDFQRNAVGMMQALADSGRRNARIEAKLDYLMRVMGHGPVVDQINATVNAALGGSGSLAVVDVATAAVPSPHGDAGSGGYPDASHASDDGSEIAPRTVGNGRDHAAPASPIGYAGHGDALSLREAERVEAYEPGRYLRP